MKVRPYKPPTVRFVPRKSSVNQQHMCQNHKISLSNSCPGFKHSRQTSISFINKRQTCLNAEKHPNKDQQSIISTISNGGRKYRNLISSKGNLPLKLSTNKNVRGERFPPWNSTSNSSKRLSLGNVNDMKHQSKQKKNQCHQMIKWCCRPLPLCCLLLTCLILAAIPIAVVFGLRSEETNQSLSCKTLLNFENLSNQTSSTIVNGYGGLNWLNIGTLVAINRSDGYRTAMISASCVAYSPGARSGSITSTTVGTTFSLVSFYVAAPWFNETMLTITGSRAGTQLYSSNVMIFTVNATFVTLNWANVDNVTFSGVSTVYHNSSYYSIDNMCLG